MIRKRGNSYEVRIYDAKQRKSVSVGSRPQRGRADGDPEFEAKALEHHAIRNAGRSRGRRTVRSWADEWLNKHHGIGTKRPEHGTYTKNRDGLRSFLHEFGDRPLASVRRDEAHDFAQKTPWSARVARTLFNDALRRDLIEVNPFDKAEIREGEGRRNIVPITEAEVDRMAELAIARWKGYGPMCAAWITFSAWVGTRPGEQFGLTWDHVDLKGGMVYVPPELAKKDRGKPRSRNIILPDKARDALVAMNTLRKGLLFTNVSGGRLTKNGYRYYWEPVRSSFASELEPARRAKLLQGRPDIDLYELRHMCASVLADRGLSAEDISYQLGNSPQVCRDIYMHLFQDRVQDRLRAAYGRNVYRPSEWQEGGSEAVEGR